MNVEELKGQVPNELLEAIGARSIKKLTPPQELSLDAGLLQGSDIVVSAPTASGKTLIAEMAMIKAILQDRRKAVYVAPMRALVTEKYEEFKAFYPYLKSAVSIGDLDSLDIWLARYDAIFVSTEKFDSLIRHGVNWLHAVGCIVFDEIHMIGESDRGATLEILISKLRRLCRNSQKICLSATIGNANELAEWLGAKLVSSNYRPVELKKGIEYEGKAFYEDGEFELNGKSIVPEVRITEDVIEKGKQLLLFYASKRNTEAGAERIGKRVSQLLSKEEKEKCELLAKDVLKVLPRPTAQCEKLSRCIANGVAFHHSGLLNEQRKLVEEAFRGNVIKGICSTTTLGLGVNLPAHTVVVRDTRRYSAASGSARIGVNEVTQLFGRAGRPKYDKEGRALLIAKSKREITELYMLYINASLDPVESNLGVLPILRSHILAFIATDFLTTKESISGFFAETFYGYQYGNTRDIERLVNDVLSELESWGFIFKRGSFFRATPIGSRVSELYIDPLSAKWLIDSLQKERDEIANLFMICNTVEMRPYVKTTEEAEEKFVYYNQFSQVYEMGLDAESLSYYDPVKPFSTGLMLQDWADERTEQETVKKYSTTPGALFAKVYNADWLLYAAMEIAKLMHIRSRDLLELRVRIKYGIKKELLDLVRLEQIGRVRARILYDNGFKKVSDLEQEGSKEKVQKLLGKELTNRIFSQIENRGIH